MAKGKTKVKLGSRGDAVPVPRDAPKPQSGNSESSATSHGHSVVNYSKWDAMASTLSDDEDGPPRDHGSADSE